MGSHEVNTILSRYVGSRAVPERIGDLDPARVVAIWVEHGEPVVDGWIVFDMAWLLH